MIEGNFNIEVQIQVESPTCVSQLQIDARYMSFEKYEKLKSAFLYENGKSVPSCRRQNKKKPRRIIKIKRKKTNNIIAEYLINNLFK